MNQEFVSTQQFADMAGVHIATVRNWIKSGKLKAVQPFQRSTWRIPASELKKFQVSIGDIDAEKSSSETGH